MAYFWLSNYAADIISAFLGTGILRMRGLGGKEGWRYLFLLEGIFTLAIGIASFFLMPPGPTQTRAWYRPKGWFDERYVVLIVQSRLLTQIPKRQEVIMVNRVLRDDPTKSDMHNREGLSIAMIWQACCDWRLWPIYALGLVHMMPVGPPQTYLTLSLRSLGFSTTETNLLTIPSVVIGAMMLLFTAYFSEKVNSRVSATIILQLWALPLLVALYTFDQSTSQWVYFAVVTLVTGFPYVHPIQVAWASRNSYSVRTRYVSSGFISTPSANCRLEQSQLLCTTCLSKPAQLSTQTSIVLTISLYVSAKSNSLCSGLKRLQISGATGCLSASPA
jgi:predicted MFS family arabinose efflux permease